MEDVITKCPRFSKCSVNKCPLDSDIRLRKELNDEEKCNMEKSVRLRIGKQFNLEKQGLTNAEFSAFQKWNGRSEEEKSEIRNKMIKLREMIPMEASVRRNLSKTIGFSDFNPSFGSNVSLNQRDGLKSQNLCL